MKNEQISQVALRDIGKENGKNQYYLSEWLCKVSSVDLNTKENRRLNKEIVNEYKRLMKYIRRE